MRTFQSLHILSTLLLLTSLSTAWPWPPSIEKIKGLKLKRQQASSISSLISATATISNTDSSKPTATATNSPSGSGSITSKPTPSATDSSAPTSASSNSADSAASSGTAQSGSSTKNDKPSATTEVDPRLPAGGVQMVTPSAIAGAQYYKVGDYVTFGWNYTSLVVTPSAVDIIASCSANNQAYTIATNQSVGPTGSVTWDTRQFATGTAPLLTEKYTLIIHDAAKDVSATAQAGYLGTFNQFTFGMYTPQPYVPLGQYICATCSGALSDMERHAVRFMLGMGLITVLSFTWFAGGFGAFC